MFKKVLPVFIVISFILAAVGSTAGVAFAAGVRVPNDATTTTSTAFGMEGFYSKNAAFAGDVAVSKFAHSEVRGLSGVKFIGQILALEPASRMAKGDKIAGPAYSYFDLSKAEARELKGRSLSIYYLAPKSNSWTRISTRLISGPFGERAIARTMGDGWYALGLTM